MTEKGPAKILIVDDNIQNIELLEAHLNIAGYDTMSCTNGFEALEMIQKTPPDLILLDIMMPQVNGFEICKQIKASSTTKLIPIIMLTALKEIEDKIKGIESGAEEFLTKPFNKLELLTRVKSLLKVKYLHEELENSNKELQSALNNLQELERLKDDLIHMLVHDLKNPLHGLSLSLHLILSEKVGPLTADQKEIISDSQIGAESLLQMVSDMLDITRMEQSKLQLNYELINLSELLNEVTKKFDIELQETGKTIAMKNIETAAKLCADANIIGRVLTNLISNSIKHSFSKGVIEIIYSRGDKETILAVKDYGEGIPEDNQKHLFEKFSRVDPKRRGYKYDTGLGLAFCKLAVETHSGRIWAESKPEKGATFYFSLPDKPEFIAASN